MIQQATISSWTELAALIESHSDGAWLFRGEDAEGNLLRPAAGRVGRERGAARKKPYNEKHEIEALRLFKREVKPHLVHQPETELEWLAVAQHHGMATRLLDWTESLLVAAYFAVVDAGVRSAGVIYGVKNLPTVTDAQAKKPFKIEEVRLYRPPHITSRIPAQRSVFTIHSNPVEEFRSPSLQKWLVDRTACGRIKHILNSCAINESSLFPGIDGLSRYIRWRYKWAKFAEDA
jgi:hypothetical protein